MGTATPTKTGGGGGGSLNRGELASIERAAQDAGIPVSTFIRGVALRAAAEGDDAAAQGRIAELVRHMRKDLATLARQLRFTA